MGKEQDFGIGIVLVLTNQCLVLSDWLYWAAPTVNVLDCVNVRQSAAEQEHGCSENFNMRFKNRRSHN